MTTRSWKEGWPGQMQIAADLPFVGLSRQHIEGVSVGSRNSSSKDLNLKRLFESEQKEQRTCKGSIGTHWKFEHSGTLSHSLTVLARWVLVR